METSICIDWDLRKSFRLIPNMVRRENWCRLEEEKYAYYALKLERSLGCMSLKKSNEIRKFRAKGRYKFNYIVDRKEIKSDEAFI